MARPPERRSPNRLPTPVCSDCQTAANVRAVTRVDYAVYFRCVRCGTTWGERKPDAKHVNM